MFAVAYLHIYIYISTDTQTLYVLVGHLIMGRHWRLED